MINGTVPYDPRPCCESRFKEQNREVTGYAIAKTILEKLEDLGLNCEYPFELEYDGSGSMAGRKKVASSTKMSLGNIHLLLKSFTKLVYSQLIFPHAYPQHVGKNTGELCSSLNIERDKIN